MSTSTQTPELQSAQAPILAHLLAGANHSLKLSSSTLNTEPSNSPFLCECSFRIKSYRLMDSVIYNSQLLIYYPELMMTQIYPFTTRYSMLFKLHQRIIEEGNHIQSSFPPKLWWGNTDPVELSKRMKRLEEWLNKAGQTKSKIFHHFISQIKKNSQSRLESDLKI